MVIEIHNLPECIKTLQKMGKITDNPRGVVFTPIEYAPYQEFGYSRKIRKGDQLFGGKRTAVKDTNIVYAGKPFMRPALDKNRKLINKYAIAYVQKILKERDSMELKPFIQLATRIVQKTAKELAPYKTGRLKGSIRAKTVKSGK